MDTYTLKTAATVEHYHHVLGRIRAEFDKGEVTPKNEQEELAIKLLEARGVAKVAPPKPKKTTPKGDDE